MSPRFGWSDLVLGRQSDERLLALAADGNGRAFATLIERHRRLLLAMAGRIAGHERREDVLQLSLLRAWSALCAGVEVHQPQAWLHQIVRNVALTERARNHASTVLPEELEDDRSTATSAEQRLEVRELLRNLSALPECQRVALVSTELGGLSRREIAADLGTSEGAVRQLVHRARTTVRTAMTGILPAPVLIWLDRCARLGGLTGSPDGSSSGLAGMSAVTASGAVAGGLVKIGTVLLAAGAFGGGLVWHELGTQQHPDSSASVSSAAGAFPGPRTSSVVTAVLGNAAAFSLSRLAIATPVQPASAGASASKPASPLAPTVPAALSVTTGAGTSAVANTSPTGTAPGARAPLDVLPLSSIRVLLPVLIQPLPIDQPAASKPKGSDSGSTATTTATTTASGTSAQSAVTNPGGSGTSDSTTSTDTTATAPASPVVVGSPPAAAETSTAPSAGDDGSAPASAGGGSGG